MFKKIFRLTITAACLVTKFVPQAIIISIASEIAAIALEFIVKKSQKKKFAKKALAKLGDKVVFITQALVDHSESEVDDDLLKEVKRKFTLKKARPIGGWAHEDM